MIKSDICKDIKDRLVNELRNYIKDIETIKEDSNLIEYGLSSIQIMQLSTMLRKMGIKLSFSKMISNPSLKSWATMIKDIKPKNIKSQNKKDLSKSKDKEAFSLTDVQYAYWIGRQDDQPMGGVGCHAYLEFDGENINLHKLEKSWNKLQMIHPMLRMKFLEDGTQMQMEEPYSKKIYLNDLREEDESLTKDKLKQIREKLSHRKLKVEEGQVAGLTLTLMAKGKTRIHLDIDLLVADVQSLSIIIRDLSRIYNGKEIHEEAFKFKNYLSKRKDQLDLEKKEASTYWQNRLSKMPGAPALPLKIKPEMIKKPFFKRRKYFIDKSSWEKIKKNSAKYKTTPAMVLLTVYALVLERWSFQNDFLINVPLFNREEDEKKIKNAVADFTNLLLLEVHSNKNMTFFEMLNQIQNQFYDSVDNSAYSGVQVQRDLAKLHLGERFLAPVVFACNLGTPLISSKDEQILGNLNYMISQTPQVWLDFQVYEKDGGVLLTWDAVDELFPENMIDDMFLSYRNSLEMLKENKQWQLVTDVLPKKQKYMRENDLKLVLNESKDNNLLYSDFLENAKRFPKKVALINSVTEEKISYKELLVKSLNIAAMLKKHGVKNGDYVGITLSRGIKQVEAILGILMVGACYVPVGINQPFNRREKIHKKIGIKYVLSSYNLNEKIKWPSSCNVLLIEDSKEYKPLNKPIEVSKEESAYIIMTSGSTGEPKGVEVSHCSVLNTINDINKKFNISLQDSILSVSSIDFDLSVYDIFGLLSKGGTVVFNTEESKKDATHWINIIKKYNITIWNSVPILLDMLVTMAEGEDQKLPLKVAMLSGDWIGLDLPKRLFDVCLNCKLIAMGGATEASIWSNYFDVTVPIPEDWKSIPYGMPLTNQTYKVVDSKERDCPNWVPGELWIGGLGVVKGYKGDKELTEKKFIKKDNIPWYKTGDMGRFWEDGTIEFLGRIDYQVKIKGHRIELGEIETAINKISTVDKSLVKKQVKGKHEYLLAYIISKKSRDQNDFIKEIKYELQKVLPSYMIPESFIFLKEFPLTSNGKINYKALPLDVKKDNDKDMNMNNNNTKTEEILLKLWKDTFKNSSINKYKNFFEIGGDSLSATKICANINKFLGVNINISVIFEKLTIENIAKEVDALKSKNQIEFIHKIEQDEISHYKEFPLTDVQYAYLVGRSGAYDFGKTSSHFYYEMDCKDVDIYRLEDTWNKLIKEHDALRIVILKDNLNQKILENVFHYEIETYNLTNMSSENKQRKLMKIREEMSTQVLDVYKWPIFDIRYSIINSDKKRIHISFDNMILDGFSILYLLHEWSKLYYNPKLKVEKHNISYRDYVLGLKEIKESIHYKKSKDYWINKLDQIYNAPELPIKNTVEFNEKAIFKRYGGRISKEDWEILKDKAKYYDITPSVVLLTAFSEVLYPWSKKSEFTINLTLFNKIPMNEELENVIGDFTSLMLLSIKTGKRDSFVDKCLVIQKEMTKNYENLYFDGVEVQREIAKFNKTSKSVVMPVVFTSTLGVIDNSSDLLGKLNYGITQTPQVWLDHQIREEKEELVFNWDVIEGLFPKGLIDEMFGTYKRLITRLVKNDYLWNENRNTLVNIPSISLREKVNKTEKSYKETTLLNMFEKNIKNNGDKEAIVLDDKILSYKNCNKLSNIVSQRIKNSSDCVAIIMEKSIEQIISVIGVMKSGKAYLPIDIGNPVERIEKIITSSKVNRIITKEKYIKKLKNISNVDIISFDMDLENETIKENSEINDLNNKISPKDLAYVIYTSGSTGMPKGVMIQHKAAANTILDINYKYEVSNKDKILALSNLAFDLSVYDIFGMFQAGGSIVMPSSEEIRNPYLWIKMIEKNNITIWNSVPMFMEMLLEYLKTNSKYIEKIQSLRLVLLSGDWIAKDLPKRIKEIFKNSRVICLGGGTEASIWSNYYEPKEINDDWISIPYGYPLANQQYHVLNKDMLNCPNYVPGEIYISGEGLAKGYLNEEKLTKERFPISKRLGMRLYKTGDIGKYEEDGTLLFLGREDAQVKINGYRVELGEIESALNNISYVETSVAMIDDKGKLITFVVSKDINLNHIEEKVVDEISDKLPDYCIPSRVFPVKKLPLNSNGKIDRKKLKKSIEGRENNISKETASGEIEILISKVWKEILDIEDIYRDDEFFKIGGDSLKAIKIVAYINKKLESLELEISDLFNYPTVRKLSKYIEEKNKKSENSFTEGVL